MHNGVVQEGRPVQAADAKNLSNRGHSSGRSARLIQDTIAILGHSNCRVRDNRVAPQQLLRPPSVVQKECLSGGMF